LQSAIACGGGNTLFVSKGILMSESSEITPPDPKPPAKAAKPGRKANGQFAEGNSGGPGSPIIRHTAEYRRRVNEAAGSVFPVDELKLIFTQLREDAKKGGMVGVAASKVVLEIMAPALSAMAREKLELVAFASTTESTKTGIDYEQFRAIFAKRTRTGIPNGDGAVAGNGD
jgi:hypothetical protein